MTCFVRHTARASAAETAGSISARTASPPVAALPPTLAAEMLPEPPDAAPLLIISLTASMTSRLACWICDEPAACAACMPSSATALS